METAWLVPGTPACCMPTAGEEDGREGFAPTCCGTTTECYHWARKLQDMQSRNDYKVQVWFRWSQPSKLKPKFWSKPPQNLLASTVYDLVCDCSTDRTQQITITKADSTYSGSCKRRRNYHNQTSDFNLLSQFCHTCQHAGESEIPNLPSQ